MPCRIYKLDCQEKKIERQARDLEIRDSNPGPGSNFSLENLIYFFTLILLHCRTHPLLSLITPYSLCI